jgi:serine/threonine protein kinase
VVSEEFSADTGAFKVSFAAGAEIAGYRLDEEIGQGSAAVVYRARDERVGRMVALKILAPELADDETFRQWFVQELRAVTAIRNPHIVPVFEAGEADGLLYLAMRYVPGGDARSLARREGPMPPGRVAAIVWQTASALDAMHAAGLVHRDVKPTNILVDVAPGRRDWVYLSDFALRIETAHLDGPARARPPVSTLACVAPELIEGGPVDGRADEYAHRLAAVRCGRRHGAAAGPADPAAANADVTPARASRRGR